jgi:hypothetical protein
MHNVNLLIGADAKLIYDFEANISKGVSLAFGGLYRASSTKAFSTSWKGRKKHFAIEEKYVF